MLARTLFLKIKLCVALSRTYHIVPITAISEFQSPAASPSSSALRTGLSRHYATAMAFAHAPAHHSIPHGEKFLPINQAGGPMIVDPSLPRWWPLLTILPALLLPIPLISVFKDVFTRRPGAVPISFLLIPLWCVVVCRTVTCDA